ncbi:conserved hypothetical protein [Trichinella spiralis]|uniref:hypothetical protein n=1 Tax=Trichinella spiralis TaxID=6334 RepID=UPI0001EFD7C8|nr:conserved hypothetical protein [Trichinella spiralis]
MQINANKQKCSAALFAAQPPIFTMHTHKSSELSSTVSLPRILDMIWLAYIETDGVSSGSTGTRVSWLLLSCCCTFSTQPGSVVFHMPPDGPSRATSVGVFDPRLGVTQPRTDFVQLARVLCFHQPTFVMTWINCSNQLKRILHRNCCVLSRIT